MVLQLTNNEAPGDFEMIVDAEKGVDCGGLWFSLKDGMITLRTYKDIPSVGVSKVLFQKSLTVDQWAEVNEHLKDMLDVSDMDKEDEGIEEEEVELPKVTPEVPSMSNSVDNPGETTSGEESGQASSEEKAETNGSASEGSEGISEKD